MTSADEIRDVQRATWAGLSAGWEKWDSIIMDQLGPVGAAIIERLGIAEDHQHLDIAAGTGEPGLSIARLSPKGRVVLTDLVAEMLDALASAGRLDELLTAIAIDGKWLRGIGDGQQVKLFAAMLQAEKVIIAQHAIPEDTNETTQVKELLGPVDLTDAVVTGDAAHSHRATAQHIAAPADEGGRGSDYFLYVTGNEPTLQRAVYDAIQAPGARKPDFCEMDYGHGRIIKRSLWVTGAGGLDFPYVTRVVRIQRDGYDAAGTRVSKEIVHAVTSLGAGRAGPADLARIARGQWGIESMIIMASASGTPALAIARLVAADEDTVREVVHAFNEKGLAALDPDWAGGRPRQITDDDAEFIVAAAGTR